MCTPSVLEGTPSDADAVRARAVAAGTCRRRTGFGTTYGHICMCAVWTTHDLLRAQNRRKPISESSACIYIPVYIPKPEKKKLKKLLTTAKFSNTQEK